MSGTPQLMESATQYLLLAGEENGSTHTTNILEGINSLPFTGTLISYGFLKKELKVSKLCAANKETTKQTPPQHHGATASSTPEGSGWLPSKALTF